jgi:Fe-S cluster assembly protein SufD
VVQDQSSDSLHLSTFGVSLAAGARYESVVLQIGARLARHEVHATLAGDGAHLGIAGGALAGEGQHIDNSTRVVHAGLGSTSQQLFKTVLDGSGHGVFLGTVEVGEGAQKTDAQQLSRTLMLSDRAIMDAKPELLIFADDVKCSHGATVGDIDEQALFYMRSRGIDEATARQLLTEGFLVEVIDRIADGPTRDLCADLIAARLHKETA